MRNDPLTPEERTAIHLKLGRGEPLAWAECDRLLDHIAYLEAEIEAIYEEEAGASL